MACAHTPTFSVRLAADAIDVLPRDGEPAGSVRHQPLSDTAGLPWLPFAPLPGAFDAWIESGPLTPIDLQFLPDATE